MRNNHKDTPNTRTVGQMSKQEYVRWMCLIKAMDVIDEYTENKNITANNVELSILPIQKFINEIEPKMALMVR